MTDRKAPTPTPEATEPLECSCARCGKPVDGLYEDGAGDPICPTCDVTTPEAPEPYPRTCMHCGEAIDIGTMGSFCGKRTPSAPCEPTEPNTPGGDLSDGPTHVDCTAGDIVGDVTHPEVRTGSGRLASIDPCVAAIVIALNKGGVKTVACCCGHGRSPGNIMLADGRELIIAENYEQGRAVESAFHDNHGNPIPPPGGCRDRPMGEMIASMRAKRKAAAKEPA